MKYLIFLILSLPFFSIAQEEFESNSPFMYDSSTMIQLKMIVDSLNLKFRQCDLDREFRSKRQAHGWQVRLKGDRVKELELMLAKSPTINEIKAQFPEAHCFESVFIEYAYSDYGNKKKLKVYAYPGETTILLDDTKKNREKMTKGRSILSSPSSQNNTTAFFFEENLTTSEIPLEYARMIQYVDCMVDTNSIVILENADYGRYNRLPENYQKMPLEQKKKLLEEMRKTIVRGGCSMDNSPRFHARDIAILSAEALEWQVFLRAHLDVMNDRFERMSDGSYAWAGRGTYIKELEEIDIDVLSLIIGTSLRMDNPADNHYYGSIARIGRAVAESENIIEFHALMEKMMNDELLDDYNKILIYYLWRNANSYMPEEIQPEMDLKLKNASAGLSSYFLTENE